MRLPVNQILPLAATMTLGLALGACSSGSASTGSLASAPRTGPAADYPVVIGEPFTIGDTIYRPDDQLNYDAVGLAIVDDAETLGISGAHKTLPLPSYVEVTSLDSGRTILVRLERRGPMSNGTLLGLSPAALAQLGATGRTPVRVRRVNPPEVERSALRSDGEVPVRMDTPEPLLKVLRRKLAEQSPLAAPATTPPAMPDDKLAAAGASQVAPGPATPDAEPEPVEAKVAALDAAPASSISQVEPDSAAAPRSKPAASPADLAVAVDSADQAIAAPEAKPAPADGVIVQVGAFSNEQGARKLAKTLDAQVSRPGKYWLVRMGPFASRGDAGPALEKARSAGYSDARIQRIN